MPPTLVESGADLSTWVFLGALAGATAGVLSFYGRAIRGWVPPASRTDLVSPEHFTRVRGVEPEVDLGAGWRSSDDPGAAWHLWWLPRSGEVVGLRTSAAPPPPGPAHLGAVYGRSLLDPVGVHHLTGMRVLGHLEQRPPRSWLDVLRPLPDGLDALTGGTRTDLDDLGDDDEVDDLVASDDELGERTDRWADDDEGWPPVG